MYLEQYRQIGEHPHERIKLILSTALETAIQDKNTYVLDLDLIDLKKSITWVYRSISLCSIIHSSIHKLGEELMVKEEGSVVDLQAKIKDLVRVYYGNNLNRQQLDSIICKLPEAFQEEIFVKHLPNVTFPSNSISSFSDQCLEVAGEEVENLPCFHFLPDIFRDCLISRLMIIIFNTTNKHASEWESLKKQTRRSEEAANNPRSLLRRLIEVTDRFISSLRERAFTKETGKELVEDIILIMEGVKEQTQNRHPLQSTVIYTMNIFWKFIRSPDSRGAPVIESFDKEINEYHKKARLHMPKFMDTISGPEKNHSVASFQNMLLSRNRDPTVRHYENLQLYIEKISQFLLSAKKVVTWMQRKAHNNISKSNARKCTIGAIVGKTKEAPNEQDYDSQMYEELDSIVELLNTPFSINHLMKHTYQTKGKPVPNCRPLKTDSISIYDLCAKDGQIYSAASFYAKVYNNFLDESYKSAGLTPKTNIQEVDFDSFDRDKTINLNRSQIQSLLQFPDIFEDEQKFVLGIRSIIDDSKLQARKIRLDENLSIATQFKFSDEQDEPFLDLLSRNPDFKPSHQPKISTELIEQLPVKWRDMLELEWNLIELAAAQKPEIKLQGQVIRVEDADRVHLALMMKKLAYVYGLNKRKIKERRADMPKYLQASDELIRRVGSIGDIDRDESLWQKKACELVGWVPEDGCTVAGVIILAHHRWESRRFN